MGCGSACRINLKCQEEKPGQEAEAGGPDGQSFLRRAEQLSRALRAPNCSKNRRPSSLAGSGAQRDPRVQKVPDPPSLPHGPCPAWFSLALLVRRGQEPPPDLQRGAQLLPCSESLGPTPKMRGCGRSPKEPGSIWVGAWACSPAAPYFGPIPLNEITREEMDTRLLH